MKATVIPSASIGLLAAGRPARNACSVSRIFLAGLVVAVAGLAYEYVSGVGRVGWCVCAAQPGYTGGLEWAQRGGGPVFIDWVVGASAFTLAELAWIVSTAWADSCNSSERASLLRHASNEETAGAARAAATEDVSPSAGWQSRRTRVYSLLYIIYTRHFRDTRSPSSTHHGGHWKQQQHQPHGPRTQPAAATGGKYGAHDGPKTVSPILRFLSILHSSLLFHLRRAAKQLLMRQIPILSF